MNKNTHTHTHAHTSIPVYPLWFSATRGILVKLCPSMHAEQGITTQFSPQRAKNQPNPAWDYTLLLTSSSSFHALSLSLSLVICLSLNPSFSSSLHHVSLFSSLSDIFDTRPLSWLCVSAPTTPLLSPPEKQGKHRQTNIERVAVYWRGVKGKQHRPTEDWLETLIGRDQRGGLVKRII